MKGLPWTRGWVAARALLLLFASLFIMTLLVRSVGLERIGQTLGEANVALFVASGVLYVFELLVRILRWRLLLPGASTGAATTLWCIGAGVNEILPSGAGEIARGVVGSKRYGIPFANVLAPTAVERVMDMAVLVGFAAYAIAIVVLPWTSLALVVPVLGVLAGVAFLLRPRLLAPIAAGFAKRTGLLGRFGLFLHRLQAAVETVAARRATLGVAMALTLVIWTMEGVIQWMALRALGATPSPVSVVAITALAFLIGFVSFLPGGLGSREAALAGLLQTVGVAAHIGTIATVTTRAYQTLLVLILGAGAALFAFRLNGRRQLQGPVSQQPAGPQSGTVGSEVAPVLPQD